jgi:hypothetical protein
MTTNKLTRKVNHPNGKAPPLIPTHDNKEECLLDYRYNVLGHNSHRCCFTCLKKGDECRFNYPRTAKTEDEEGEDSEDEAQLTSHAIMGRVISHIQVIEFQKSGLPHAHLLIRLANDEVPTVDSQH